MITTAANHVNDIHIADLDNDGDPDVLAANQFGNETAWYENVGGGVFVTRPVSIASNARAVHSADLDGDGDIDVISANNSTVAWHENLLSSATLTSAASTYGTGCGNAPMNFVPTSTAIVGATMTGTISNTPTPLCVIAMGLSNTSKPGLGLLPFDLGVIGMTGCSLYQSAEVFGLGTQLGGIPFVVDWIYPVPGGTAALGAHVYTQAFSLAPAANPLQIVASNGIDWLIGNQ